MSISLNIDLKLNTIHELEVITPLVFLFLKSCLILIKNMKGVKMSKKQYKSLDYNSRVVLEQLLKAGYSKKDIAVTIGVSYYTILRELKINNMTALTYNAQEELKKQYGETLIAKDKAYNLMAEKADEAERKLEAIIKENEQLKNTIEDIKKKAQQSSIKQRVPEEQPEEPEHTGLFAGFKKKKPKNDNAAYIYETFMNEILMNKDFSDEQKNFLIDCLDENMPYEEIKRLAKPELDVAMMKRLKTYYKKRIK